MDNYYLADLFERYVKNVIDVRDFNNLSKEEVEESFNDFMTRQLKSYIAYCDDLLCDMRKSINKMDKENNTEDYNYEVKLFTKISLLMDEMKIINKEV